MIEIAVRLLFRFSESFLCSLDLMEKQTRFEQEQEDIREAARRLPRNAPARLLPGLSRVANMQVETRQEENYPLDKTTSAEKTETLTKQEFRNGDNWKGQMLPPPPRSPKTFHVANGSASTESSMKAKLSQPTVSDTRYPRRHKQHVSTLFCLALTASVFVNQRQ